MMSNIQFPLIKKHMLGFLALLFFSIVLVSVSIYFKQNQLDDERSIEMQMRATRANIANILQDKMLINSYQQPYSKLLDRGFFSEEKRLPWIEQLEETATRLLLPDLHYQIDSQLELKRDVYSSPQGVVLYKSDFSFQSSLLHEGDLLELIADLKRLDSGLLVVEHCDLSRRGKLMSNSTKHKSLNFNFHVLCNASWYTSGEHVVPSSSMRNER